MVNTTRSEPVKRLSDHFRLEASQNELDFVDIPLDTDIPLFVDPYALGLETDAWFRECSELVMGFFQHLIDACQRRCNNPQIAG